MTELDKLYNCVDYTIKIELNSKGMMTTYEPSISPYENDLLSILHNKDGKLEGNIVLSDGNHTIKEPFEMDFQQFKYLNYAIENTLDERNGWKRTLNAFISTKLDPMNINKSETKECFNISMEEFLIDMDVECFYLESDIRDYESLGRELVDIEGLEIPTQLENHIDYSSYAHEWNDSYYEPKGIMTRWGYLYYSEYGSLL